MERSVHAVLDLVSALSANLAGSVDKPPEVVRRELIDELDRITAGARESRAREGNDDEFLTQGHGSATAQTPRAYHESAARS